MTPEALGASYELQARFCHGLDAPFLGSLMERAALDARSGGAAFRCVEGWEGDPLRGFLPLRVFAAAHRRVLRGSFPELARFYPTAGGEPDPEGAWPALRDWLAAAWDEIAPELDRFPQTNEVARSGALLPGLLRVARTTERPLHLLEIGASAGLNLLVDAWRHEIGQHVLGDPASPVRIPLAWSGPPEPLAGRLAVASRAGCDLAPVDPADPDAMLWMTSFVWPDHVARFERMRAAIALAAGARVGVERARAGEWLGGRLAARPGGAAVVYHSSFWAYVPREERKKIRSLLEEEGARADAARPLAYLRLEEGVDGRFELRLRLWPGGEDRILLRTLPHPRRLEWVDELVPSPA